MARKRAESYGPMRSQTRALNASSQWRLDPFAGHLLAFVGRRGWRRSTISAALRSPAHHAQATANTLRSNELTKVDALRLHAIVPALPLGLREPSRHPNAPSVSPLGVPALLIRPLPRRSLAFGSHGLETRSAPTKSRSIVTCDQWCFRSPTSSARRHECNARAQEVSLVGGGLTESQKSTSFRL